MNTALKQETTRLWSQLRRVAVEAVERDGGRLDGSTKKLITKIVDGKEPSSSLKLLPAEQRRLAVVGIGAAFDLLIHMLDQNIAMQAEQRRELSVRLADLKGIT